MLELRNICKKYGDRALAAGLSLQVGPGETLALLGPSGAGKSTLLKIAAGLEPPDQGSVWFNGQDITGLAPERRGFALMFQDFALFPHLNVLDNVAFGLVEQGIKRPAARERAAAMLSRFGLAEHAQQRVWTLSGGEQQRVSIARAFVNRPLILLADEPTGNLDTSSGNSIMQLLAELHSQGRTVLVVTHDPRMTAYATHTVYMLDGRIVPEDTYQQAITAV